MNDLANLSLRGLKARSNLCLQKIMIEDYFIYIMTNKNNTVLYTGVTNNLKRRVNEHKNKLINGFTKKYNIEKLVYYEIFNDIRLAIEREKQIKGG